VAALLSPIARSTSQVELDFVELWVFDFDRTRGLLCDGFGLRALDVPIADTSGDRVGCFACEDVRFVVRSPTSGASALAQHLDKHGDTVANLALVADNPNAVLDRARARGLHVFDHQGAPAIDLLGDGTICHSVTDVSFISRTVERIAGPLQAIDHLAYCLPWSVANTAAEIYEDVFALERLELGDAQMVGDDVSGMHSVAVRSQLGFTVVLTEPASQAAAGSQTQRFIDTHAGPGVQHAAIRCPDLGAAVKDLRANGIEFLEIPEAYYAHAKLRLPQAQLAWDTLQRLSILVDAENDGLLFQLFTKPITARGTFFFELIQRAGATGFGANNVRALFEAIDAETGEVGS
jgi:4-hydroxyphenylpyruvate dioxygenase